MRTRILVVLVFALLLSACGSDSVQWSSTTSNDGFDTQGGGTLGIDVRKYEGVAPQYENVW